MCNAVWDRLERFTPASIQSPFDKSILIHIWSRFNKLKLIRYKLKSFCSKSELEEIFQWKSFHIHIAYDTITAVAIDWKNVIPEGEKSCLSGGLGTFSASWIQWTSSLKPTRFKGKSDEPYSGTNRPVLLISSKRGNFIMTSDCQVP